MRQLYLLKSWRVSFNVANKNCHIKKIARVDGALVLGKGTTFKSMHVHIWKTEIILHLNSMDFKNRQCLTVFIM